MKKYLFFVLLVFSLGSCCTTINYLTIDDEFLVDLSSENNKISADLLLDEFDGSLDSLTYQFYLEYIKIYHGYSSEYLYERINLADDVLFQPYSQGFIIILRYLKLNKIIIDDSFTPFHDQVIENIDSNLSLDDVYNEFVKIYSRQKNDPKMKP
ncbi:MAG: hypothetical protein IPH62_11595 [Ignavibacteriae bacterium]|nr:hypothetical protein [Ignavibacteriota bacterium]